MKMRSNNDSRRACVSLGLALAVVLMCYGSASAQVAPGNPVSAYLFDEGTGTTTADSFGSNDGTLEGVDIDESGTVDPVELPSWQLQLDSPDNTPFGYAGNSSLLLGEAMPEAGQVNWVNLGNPANLDFVANDGAGGGDAYTISAWVSNNAGGTFVSKAGGPGADRQYQLFAGGGPAGRVDAVVGGAATFNNINQSDRAIFGRDLVDLPPDGNFWDHVALVVESPTLANLYVNGFLATTLSGVAVDGANGGAPGTMVQPTANVLIGVRNAETAPTADDPIMPAFIYDGRIDEVAFWDTALTQENIDWLQTNSVSTLVAAGPDGDFDGDGNVDGADFLDWQRNLGDAANLSLWEGGFGTTSAVSAVASIPEPASLLLMGLGALSMTLRSVRRRR